MYTLWRQRWGRWQPVGGSPSVALCQQMAPSFLLEEGVTRVELRDEHETAIVVWTPEDGHVARVADPRN